MWQPGYLESLAPLQGALSKVGATACLKRMVQDGVKEWDFSYTEDLVHFVFLQLDLLHQDGFFTLLVELPRFARALQVACAQTWHWSGSRMTDAHNQSLAPIFEMLSRLAPDKVHATLGHLHALLADWGGDDPLQYLTRVHEDLEKVQPKSVWSTLTELRDLLAGQHRRLAWLARNPFTGKEVAPPNFFCKLQRIREGLELAVDIPGNYLLDLQFALEELDEIRAVGPSPGDAEN